MKSFELLSKNIQKKVWDMKWEQFTPIQEKAIPIIIQTNQDVIISSGTASGKTEAAFLPILSVVDPTALKALKVIYVSPIKSLINNQFERIEKLCKHTGIAIHKWHGDVGQHKKKKFVENPTGILQITPESIESLFINRTEQIHSIFNELEFVVIDELHAFLDTDRGVHLRSLLSRIANYTKKRPRIIGLSATIDNFDFVKKWVNFDYPEQVEIIESKEQGKKLLYNIMHFPMENEKEKPKELFEDMFLLTKDQKTIIFCNGRGNVEETTVHLSHHASLEQLGEIYYAHHSSIDKKEREHVEKTITESKTPKSVIATSSLEMGIDIGDVEMVVQLDSTFTVSSLKQRLGRSGRKKDSDHILQIYTTNKDSLIQSLAVMELILEKWVEPAVGYPLPYDVLFHQILSLCKETNGLSRINLIKRIRSISVFNDLDEKRIQTMIDYMVKNDLLEVIKGKNELIVGFSGEKLIHTKDFYPVFSTPVEYEVFDETKKIGTLEKLPFLSTGNNIILAGKLWTIHKIDSKKNKVFVGSSTDGDPPLYLGGAGDIHKKIREKMMEILCSKQSFSYINDAAAEILEDARYMYHFHSVKPNERVIWQFNNMMFLETFTGTKITQTLFWMLKSIGMSAKKMDGAGRIYVPGICNLLTALDTIKYKKWDAHELIPHMKDRERFASKFSPYLPEEIEDDLTIAHKIRIEDTIEYLKSVKFFIIKLD